MPPEGTSRLRDEQKILIAELAQQEEPRLEVEDIWKRVRAEFRRPDYHPPALGTVRNRVGQARKNRVAQDERWSIGVSVQAGIPIGAMKVVTEVWEYVLLGHRRHITLRQAKWIARLRDLITEKEASGSREERLYKWASLYAGREKAALTLKVKFDTSDMDASLLIKGAVYSAVVNTGLVDRFTEESRLNALAESARHLALNELASRRYIDSYLEMAPKERRHQNRVEADFNFEYRKIFGDALGDALPDEGTVNEDERRRAKDQVAEAMKVTNVWIMAFWREGERWFELTVQRRMEIVLELARKSVEPETYDDGDFLKPFADGIKPFKPFRPSDAILKEVGYELHRESEV